MKPFANATQIVHGVHAEHVDSMDLVPPLHLTATFRFRDADHGADLFAGREEGYIYSRVSNPSVDLLERKLAVLEGAEAGIAAASGMAACAAVALSMVEPGKNLVSCATLYGGTFALFSEHLKDLGIAARFIPPDQSNDRSRIEAACDADTRLMWMETPANPTLDVIDIALWADIARKRGIPLAVDNTFASPYLQRPLSMGASLAVHSATKYLNGHGDVVGGMVAGARDLIDRIRKHYMIHFGPVMSPFSAWLISRGIKTLAVRMTRHCDSARKIAAWLAGHPKVSAVHYPGLPRHPGHQLAAKQMRNFGGMIAFEVKGGFDAGKRAMNRVRLCILAVSLGDCETLIQHPASMTHATYSPEARKKAGIADGLIRLSVGLESADDIIADLDQALFAV